MITQSFQLLQNIRSLIRNREFGKALVILDTMDTSNFDDYDQALYDIIYTEVNLCLGNVQKKSQLEYSLSYFERCNDHENYAKAKYLCGWLYNELGESLLAREYLTEACVYFKRCGLFGEQARALSRLAYIAFKSGDYESALHQLNQCRNIYIKLENEENEFAILTNIYSLHYNHGRLTEARKVLTELRNIDKSESKYAYFILNEAMLSAHYHNYKLAFQGIRAYPIDRSSKTKIQAIYFENLGWIHLLAGEYKQAEVELLKGLKISLEIAPESALVSQIKRRLADACFGQKKYAKAKTYADEALVVAKKINERVEIAACHRVYAQLETVNGNEDTARSWYKQAIDMFAMIESKYELAVTRYLAATSGLYHNGERQAMLYLAREYFESEEVTHYVEKIDRELNRHKVSVKKNLAGCDRLIASSKKMKKIVSLIENIAPSHMSVLLTGATGTGKDLLARHIHACSGMTGEFVSINISAIPNAMIEAELFGYRQGAFTGAVSDRAGLIEQAGGGTLFLNEIAEASEAMQAKLLDVLERMTFRRLGENKERKVSFRLITATNKNLEELVKTNRFRADLYHRLRQVPITLPPLSSRLDDLPDLVSYFLEQSGVKVGDNGNGKLLDKLVNRLSVRDWPGNIRELKAEVDRLVVTSGRDANRLLERLSAMPDDGYDQSEHDELLALLEETNWNRREVARRLGVSDTTVRNRIRKYSLFRSW